jgi:hypothetical protein
MASAPVMRNGSSVAVGLRGAAVRVMVGSGVPVDVELGVGVLVQRSGWMVGLVRRA